MTRPAPEYGDNSVFYTEGDQNFMKEAIEVWEGKPAEVVLLLGQTIGPVCFFQGVPIGDDKFIVEGTMSNGRPTQHRVHKSHIIGG